MVETVAAVAAVAAGNLIVVRTLQGEVRGGTLLKLPLQDPAHHLAPPTGRTCTGDKGLWTTTSATQGTAKTLTICTSHSLFLSILFVC